MAVEELVTLLEALAEADALGALLPIIGAGLLDVALLEAIGLAVPEPPVIVKKVEKMGFAVLPLNMNRIANC